MKLFLLLAALVIASKDVAFAQTNLIKRALPLATNYVLSYFVAERVASVSLPDYKSKFQEKSFSFHESQKWDVTKSLEKFGTHSIVLEENGVRSFSKSLGSIRPTPQETSSARTFEFTIHVSPEGKSSLIVEHTDGIIGSTGVLVLDWHEARNVVQLIKLLPEIQKELQDKRKTP
jgi:hypothetical protein